MLWQNPGETGGRSHIEAKCISRPITQPPLYLMFQKYRLLGCRYIVPSKGYHMCFPYFPLTIDDRLEDLVNYGYMYRPYRYVVRDYKQQNIMSVLYTSVMNPPCIMIYQDEASVYTSDAGLYKPQES